MWKTVPANHVLRIRIQQMRLKILPSEDLQHWLKNFICSKIAYAYIYKRRVNTVLQSDPYFFFLSFFRTFTLDKLSWHHFVDRKVIEVHGGSKLSFLTY